MKIGFDAKRVFNNFTGLGNYSRTLLDNLRQFQPQNDYLLYTPKVGEGENTEKYQRDFPIITPTKGGLGGTYWRSYGVNKEVEREKIELFHGLSNELPLGLRKVKKVVTIHDLIFRVLPDTYPRMDRFIYDQKSKYACQNADAVIAISECTKQDIMRFYSIPEEKIKVIYQACDAMYYEGFQKADKAILEKYSLPSAFLLSVGSVIKRKNLLNVVKAVHALPENFQLPLVVVGGGKRYKTEVEAYISTHRLENRVIWLSNIHSNRELKQLYQLAQMIIYPSLYEGFGLPVVEGLLCQTPVITSCISSLKEAGAEGAYQVNPMDVEAIRNAIITILEDTDTRNRRIKEGYDFAWRTFSPEVVTKQLTDLYSNI